MLTITKSSHREEARRVVQCPHASPAHRSTIQIEILLFDSERQLCHRHRLYFNHCSCRAHSISHFRDHDAPQVSRDFQLWAGHQFDVIRSESKHRAQHVVRDPVIRRESFTNHSPSIYMTDCECRETIATVQLSVTADHSRTVGAPFTSVHKLGVGQSFKITNDQATVLGIKQLSLHHGDRKPIDAHFHGPQTLGRRFPQPNGTRTIRQWLSKGGGLSNSTLVAKSLCHITILSRKCDMINALSVVVSWLIHLFVAIVLLDMLFQMPDEPQNESCAALQG
jgi:hypothetical protein